MSALRQFTIPLSGLKNEIHQYNFSIDKSFFSEFEDSPIEDGIFEVKFILDKRADMLVLTFHFNGSMKTECDRCLANINLPVIGDEDLIIKYAAEADDNEDVIYISRDTSELNIAKYIYEGVCLAMPVTNVYDCEDEPENVCDLEMLEHLENKENSKDSKDDSSNSNSPWDVLKDFNKN